MLAAYWEGAEASATATQLLRPRAPAWRTSAHREVPLECPRAECGDEPGMATLRHAARGKRGLRFYAAPHSRTGKGSRTSAAPFERYLRLAHGPVSLRRPSHHCTLFLDAAIPTLSMHLSLYAPQIPCLKAGHGHGPPRPVESLRPPLCGPPADVG